MRIHDAMGRTPTAINVEKLPRTDLKQYQALIIIPERTTPENNCGKHG